MPWYYARDNQRFGPVDESEFTRLVDAGDVNDTTLVWREGMENWRAYRDVKSAPPVSPPPELKSSPLETFEPRAVDSSPREKCVECGRAFGLGEMVRYGDAYVCAECKPIFFQRIRETGDLQRDFVYGGFWIRFAARVVDFVLMIVVQLAVTAVFGGLMSLNDSMLSYSLAQFLSTVMGIAYEVFFLGRFGATPGKMVCGLKVVRSDGSPITYLRAFARYFAQIASLITLLIGYIMAAFDREKRALHDHICDTRVIHT